MAEALDVFDPSVNRMAGVVAYEGLLVAEAVPGANRRRVALTDDGRALVGGATAFPIPAARWRRMEPLLEANLREHEEVVRLADGIPSYASVSAQVLVLAGMKTRRSLTAPLVELANTIPAADLELLQGLGHAAPEHGAPPALTERILGFMSG